MKTQMKLQEGWIFYHDGKQLAAKVPGDVTLDLYENGVIKNPYFGLNHRELHWITDSDFTYENTFDIPDEIYSQEEILLTFDGIDTFAEIYLNGNKLGDCENMFLQYEYSVKELVKQSGNLLQVKLHAKDRGLQFHLLSLAR